MRRCLFCEGELSEDKRADAKYCDDVCGREYRRERAGVSVSGRIASRFWDRYRQIVRRSPARRTLAVVS
jgi:hypothetical protein